MKYFLVLFIFLSGCASVQVNYDQTVLPPERSAYTSSSVGYAPFKDLMENFANQVSRERDVAVFVYTYPNIPLSDERNFRECYESLPEDEQIFAIFDSTAWTTFCYGFVLTDKGIHVNYNSSQKYFISYDTLYSSTLSRGNWEIVIKTPTNNIAYLNLISASSSEATRISNIFNQANRRSRDPAYQYEIMVQDEYRITEIPDNLIDLLKASNIRDSWYAGESTNKTIERFYECAEIQDVNILAYIDTELIGSGCYGMGFTDTGIFINNWWAATHSGTHFISYDQILLSSFEPRMNGVNLFLAPTVSVDTNGFDCESCETSLGDAAGLIEILKEYRDPETIEFYTNAGLTADEVIALRASERADFQQIPYQVSTTGEPTNTDNVFTGFNSESSLQRELDVSVLNGSTSMNLPENSSPQSNINADLAALRQEGLGSLDNREAQLNQGNLSRGEQPSSVGSSVQTDAIASRSDLEPSNTFTNSYVVSDNSDLDNLIQMARSNNTNAQIQLASRLMDYSNPSRDPVEAYFWAMIAADNGGGGDAIAIANRSRTELNPQQLLTGFNRIKNYSLGMNQ